MMHPAETEAQFTDAVIGLARALGWRTAHFRPGQTKHGWATAVQGDGKGFPDILALKGDRQVIMELKAPKAPRPGIEQTAWAEAFEEVGAEVYRDMRPSDWNEIERILKGDAHV